MSSKTSGSTLVWVGSIDYAVRRTGSYLSFHHHPQDRMSNDPFIETSASLSKPDSKALHNLYMKVLTNAEGWSCGPSEGEFEEFANRIRNLYD